MTKLEAVNRILRAAKEHPVSSLGSGGENDTLVAEQILDEITRREQMAGLHLNTVFTEFTPDSTNSNRVILPITTLEVRGSRQHQHRNYFFREVAGELRLFDADETPATDEFPDDDRVYVRLVQAVAFEVMPIHHQFSIADQAAVEYAMAVLPSNSALPRLEQIAARSRAMARAHDMRNKPNNLFYDGRSQGPRIGTRWVPRSWPYNDSRRID